MFRFDFLNRRWVDDYACYLRELFGTRLEGLTAIDYAFGRGNWAVALRMAGARKVIAIDASEDNCRRLYDWLAREHITGIEIVHGNVLESPLNCTADLVWAHGILQHVEQPAQLLRALRDIAPGPDALLHVYAYDRFSLRQTIVEIARRGVCYASEEDFRDDAPLFSNRARLRVRDDLTAPVIHFLSIAELDALSSEIGLVIVQRHSDFNEWLRGHICEEFQPHNILLSSSANATRPLPPKEPARLYNEDVQLLATLAAPLFDPIHVNSAQARRNAIGLCNTHFEALAGGGIVAALQQNLLQVLYLLYSSGLIEAVSETPVKSLLMLADSALRDYERGTLELSINSKIFVPFLRSNCIRL
jgi:hypothetical protein